MEKSKDHLDTILNSLHSGFILVAVENQLILDVNDYTCRLSKYAKDDLLGKNIQEILIMPNFDDTDTASISLEKDIAPRQIRKKDGKLIPVLVSRSDIKRRGQDMQSISFIDNSAQIKAKHNLLLANQDLAKTLRNLQITQKRLVESARLSAVGEMASGIAHDLNNLLMPINAYADMLEKQIHHFRDQEEVKSYLDGIKQATNTAKDLVKRLKHFAKPHDKNEPTAPINMAKAVKSAIAFTKPKWVKRNIEIIFDETVKLPEIPAHQASINEIIVNLIFNAVDAMPEGGQIKIGLSTDDEQLTVKFSDTGTGMDESTREKCLEPFFTTKGEQGTGLGLAMISRIVRDHQSSLEIESEVGRGTTFIIGFPLS